MDWLSVCIGVKDESELTPTSGEHWHFQGLAMRQNLRNVCVWGRISHKRNNWNSGFYRLQDVHGEVLPWNSCSKVCRSNKIYNRDPPAHNVTQQTLGKSIQGSGEMGPWNLRTLGWRETMAESPWVTKVYKITRFPEVQPPLVRECSQHQLCDGLVRNSTKGGADNYKAVTFEQTGIII